MHDHCNTARTIFFWVWFKSAQCLSATCAANSRSESFCAELLKCEFCQGVYSPQKVHFSRFKKTVYFGSSLQPQSFSCTRVLQYFSGSVPASHADLAHLKGKLLCRLTQFAQSVAQKYSCHCGGAHFVFLCGLSYWIPESLWDANCCCISHFYKSRNHKFLS